MAHIIYYLNAKTVLNLSTTCKRLRSVADSKFTWNCLIARDFDSLSNAIGPNLEHRIRKPKDSYRLLSLISLRESGEKENNSDHTTNDSNQEQIDKLQTEMNNLQQLVSRLENPDTTEPLDAFQDKVLTALLKAKRKQCKDGLIVCRNIHGRPLLSIGVSRAEKGSSSASQSTIQQRSNIIEHVKQLISCKQGESSLSNDLVTQEVSLIKRDKQHCTTSAIKAEIIISGTFEIRELASIKTNCQWIPYVC